MFGYHGNRIETNTLDTFLYHLTGCKLRKTYILIHILINLWVKSIQIYLLILKSENMLFNKNRYFCETTEAVKKPTYHKISCSSNLK